MYLPRCINPIIKLTETCNYNCGFCRYANHRRLDSGISEELVKKIVIESQDYTIKQGNNSINVIFHGGEPLLYGNKRLVDILKSIDICIKPGFSINYSIQTNASLMTEEWIELFKQYNFDVGISLDGPVDLNRHWKDNSKECVNVAIEKYHELRKNGVRCGILSVITNDHLASADSFFDFFTKNNIDSLGLCYCYNQIDGNNVDPIKLGEWLIALYELYYNSEILIRIREFDTVTKRIVKNQSNNSEFECRNNCGRYFTLKPNGQLFFCDDFDFVSNKDFYLGNLNTQSISQIINEDRFKNIKTASNVMIEKKCKNCNVYSLCRGGCPRHDVDQSNYFCETYKMLYPHIEGRVLSYLNKRCKKNE